MDVIFDKSNIKQNVAFRLFGFFFAIQSHSKFVSLIGCADASIVIIAFMEYYVWVLSNYTYQIPVTWFMNIQLSAQFSQMVFYFFSFSNQKKKQKQKICWCLCSACLVESYFCFQFNSFHLLNTILWPIDVKQTTLHSSINLLFYFYSLKSVQAISVSYLCLLAKFSFKWTVFPVQNSNNLFNTC